MKAYTQASFKQNQSNITKKETVKPTTAATSLETAESAFAGMSHLPRVRMDKLQAERNLSPRQIEKRVNNFIKQKVMNSQEATALVFEELSANTSKIHRLALRQKLDTLDGHEVQIRNQTAGIGVRLNSKLMSQVGQRGTLAS